ncbi:eukaryotic translation initiation factor 4E-binding protein Mextli-like isoform X1 [Limulus polyphemus]|uniref:Eukaryotic translation initiation factor 4E-binding protein Mextli-like isoform X1 n=2 Tax=Limulus polyphemus TaxID=6850 RepID=A0ABM1S259_LIMPO|nr:eukaryotic translation initiation factor 4E-binding protein Mextli-like isoform X1 [Limulus polyphemus]
MGCRQDHAGLFDDLSENFYVQYKRSRRGNDVFRYLATGQNMSTKGVRNVRKLKRPRPLKLVSEGSSHQSTVSASSGDQNEITIDDVIHDLEALHISINNSNLDDSTLSKIIKVCSQLKSKGFQLETSYKEQLDRYFVTLRNVSRDERLNELCRMHLLEVIELRAMMWKMNDNFNNYYKQKIIQVETAGSAVSALTTNQSVTTASPSFVFEQNSVYVPSTNQSQPSLAPGEVFKSSGKFAKPTKIPGKNYFKDEIVIRNSDSGKVMGIKGRRVHTIEELSNTIISFQRVSPGTLDRVVQITGSNEESIQNAKLLIEDTIRRNASPARESTGHECSESSSSLASNLSEDSSALQTPFSIGGRKSLIHSYSTEDATFCEYSHTVYVGRNAVKLSSDKKDLVTTAKLVLEEFFAGQTEKIEKQKSPTAVHFYASGGNNQVGNRRPQSMFSADFSPFQQDVGQWDFSGGEGVVPCFPLPCYSDPTAKVSTWLCNDAKTGQVEKEASPHNSSSSNEGTYKAGENASPIDDEKSTNKEVANIPLDSQLQNAQPVSESQLFNVGTVSNNTANQLMKVPSHPEVCTEVSCLVPEAGSVKVVRQPLFPDSRKDAFEQAESTATINALSAKARRTKFARMSSTNAVEEFNEEPTSTVSSVSGICYSRDFLLDCALSPHSSAIPLDLAWIAKEAPSIIRQTTTMFNPVVYRTQTATMRKKHIHKGDSTRLSSSEDMLDNK